MRRRLPDFLTLPSRMDFTFRAVPISLTFGFLPLNENEEVRAATFKSSIFASAFNSSSANPSQKYSFSASALMLTKGRTAIDGLSASCDVGRSALRDNEGRVNVAEDSASAAPFKRRAPSARQNASASSVSTRLHVGQRFIFYCASCQLAISATKHDALTVCVIRRRASLFKEKII